MEPTTIIAIGSAAYAIGDTLGTMISEVIGNGGLALSVINVTEGTTLRLVHQSSDNDSGSHGKWIGDPILPHDIKKSEKTECQSAKCKNALCGNTNGLVYKAMKAGAEPAYLWISWCAPYAGKTYYHIQWTTTWDAEADPHKLLKGIGSRKPTDTVHQAVDGMQKASLGTSYHATGTFGTAPLKVVVHD